MAYSIDDKTIRALKSLGDGQIGRLVRAMVAYIADGAEFDMGDDPILSIVYEMEKARADMEREIEAEAEEAEKVRQAMEAEAEAERIATLRANGRRGGRPKKEPTETKKTNKTNLVSLVSEEDEKTNENQKNQENQVGYFGFPAPEPYIDNNNIYSNGLPRLPEEDEDEEEDEEERAHAIDISITPVGIDIDPEWAEFARDYEQNIGMLPIGYALEELDEDFKAMGGEVMREAVRITALSHADNPKKFMASVCKDWRKRGVDSLSKAQAACRDHDRKTGTMRGGGGRGKRQGIFGEDRQHTVYPGGKLV